ncbi:MAG: sigma 54-interacting transcriptional regulator [Clostridiales Family XIII bacterium]|jgi:transcriptional regulator with PAS, ATPase and Fis domain|nr:sigma 54-interacting transcriptional regulator [Clostridiales Family XIII bacterium]
MPKHESLVPDDLFLILDSVDDAVFIDDAAGRALWLNAACEALYKIRRGDVIGAHISALERDGVFTPSVARMVIERRKQVNIVHQNKEGKRILSTGIPVFDESGGLRFIITTSRDITELIDLQNELESVQNALEGLRTQEAFRHGDIVANSEAMRGVMRLVKRLAELDSTVLVTGESGVGKGLVAKLIHENSKRRSFPFVKVNCGAIPESLMESELFGYERGAFTGSRAEGKKGLFEAAENGSIFLDEISELPLNLQVKLLQVIQEREVKRVGGVVSIPVNARVISAANLDLFALVQAGGFREDLYYRLNVVPIHVPPLRERQEDIVPLIGRFLNQNNKNMKDHKELDPDTTALLLKYDWPGNVRELQNIMERIMITTRGSVIRPENLPEFIRNHVAAESAATLAAIQKSQGASLTDILDRAEKTALLAALECCGTTRALARRLGVSQPTVVRKLRKHGLRVPQKPQ